MIRHIARPGLGMIAALAWASVAQAADGTWINTTSGGLWSATGNWAGGVIATASGAVADFSTLDITADNTVHLDSSRTIGTLKFGDTSADSIIFVTNNGSGTIGKYTTLGATVNASLVSGLNDPTGIAESGGNLFVGDFHNFRIGEYTTIGATVNASLVSVPNGPAGVTESGGNLYVVGNQPTGSAKIGKYTTAGATVNASLVSGLNSPISIAESGGNLFVTDAGNGTIGEYTTSGTTLNAALVSGLNNPTGIVASGGSLFVANAGNGTIGQYNAVTGAPVNAALVSGLSAPSGLALFEGNLYVTNSTGTIGVYNAVTGAPVNAALVSGLSSPWGIAVVPGSTPSNWILDDNGSAGANKLTLAGSPTITVNNQTATISSVLAGSAGFTKNGAGTLILSGGVANTITGGVDVNDGAIVLNKPAGMKAISHTLTIGDGIVRPPLRQ